MPYKTMGELRFWEFEIFENYGDLTCLFSTIHGGIDGKNNSHLNLGFSDGEEKERVRLNRERFLKAAGTDPDSIAIGTQIHSTNIRSVDEPGVYDKSDGLISKQKGLSLVVSTADCIPIYLYDPEIGVIGIVHSGWKGTRDGIIAAAIKQMIMSYGTDVSDLVCGLGPSIESSCYEVGEEVAEQFEEYYLEPKGDGKFNLDLKSRVLSDMKSEGIRSGNIENCNLCTKCEVDNYFSYRRQGSDAGRMWGLIRMSN